MSSRALGRLPFLFGGETAFGVVGTGVLDEEGSEKSAKEEY